MAPFSPPPKSASVHIWHQTDIRVWREIRKRLVLTKSWCSNRSRHERRRSAGWTEEERSLPDKVLALPCAILPHTHTHTHTHTHLYIHGVTLHPLQLESHQPRSHTTHFSAKNSTNNQKIRHVETYVHIIRDLVTYLITKNIFYPATVNTVTYALDIRTWST